jgi:hypothetical protein
MIEFNDSFKMAASTHCEWIDGSEIYSDLYNRAAKRKILKKNLSETLDIKTCNICGVFAFPVGTDRKYQTCYLDYPYVNNTYLSCGEILTKNILT